MKLRPPNLYVGLCSLFMLGAASLVLSAVLESGDIVRDVRVKYTDEIMSWTACADAASPGDWDEWVIESSETGFTVAAGTAPVENGQSTFEADIPNAGMYSAQVRACNSEGCSDWIYSGHEGTLGECDGPDHVYAIIAPAGAPEL